VWVRARRTRRAARTAAFELFARRSGWLCALAQAPMRRCQLREAK
jgi:hypothetical protein